MDLGQGSEDVFQALSFLFRFAGSRISGTVVPCKYAVAR